MNLLKKNLTLLIVLISLITIFSGLAQVVMPSSVLDFIGAEISPISTHFFAIVGMFMVFFGGLMLHTIYSPRPGREAVLWCAFQKLGAFIAVSLGVINGLFGFVAVGVAIFDLFSGLLFLFYYKQWRE
jgi:hypothetical protein